MVRVTRGLAALAAAAVLTACNTMAPIQNVENVSVSSVANKPLTRPRVRAAIVARRRGLGWIMKDAGPGRCTARCILRTHTPRCRFRTRRRATASSTSRASTCRSGGKIHRNYNGWIQNLNRGINAQLAAS
jgi:hypothetical protein